MDKKLRRRIIERWMKYAPARWWGDPVDIRFFLAERLAALQGRKILDVGCNAGILASVATEAGNEVFGIELDSDALSEYRALSGAENIPLRAARASWNQLPFARQEFDTLLLGWVLYYEPRIEDKIRALSRLSDLLVPGGELLFVEANRLCPIQGRGRNCFWTPGEAAEFLSHHGYEVEELVYWNPLPSMLCYLPRGIKMQLPRNLLLTLYPPGKLVQYFPGWFEMFSRMGKSSLLQDACRSYFLRARKL
ncbi:class I SAM-dependent methyltransferase [Gemmatimonadota bacterium]